MSDNDTRLRIISWEYTHIKQCYVKKKIAKENFTSLQFLTTQWQWYLDIYFKSL